MHRENESERYLEMTDPEIQNRFADDGERMVKIEMNKDIAVVVAVGREYDSGRLRDCTQCGQGEN